MVLLGVVKECTCPQSHQISQRGKLMKKIMLLAAAVVLGIGVVSLATVSGAASRDDVPVAQSPQLPSEAMPYDHLKPGVVVCAVDGNQQETLQLTSAPRDMVRPVEDIRVDQEVEFRKLDWEPGRVGYQGLHVAGYVGTWPGYTWLREGAC